jgi:uncharacterized coiled-coil protein SlyX
MPYPEDPGYEPALHRDLEPIEQRLHDLEQRVVDLESEVRVQHAAIEGLDATLRALADQHV